MVQVHGSLLGQAARVRSLLLAGGTVVCELHGDPDLGLLDALARLRLLASRHGGRLEVQADDDGLLRLTGLSAALCGDAGGQPEAGEQRRVQEVVEVDDLPT